jgi:hypothetical protein
MVGRTQLEIILEYLCIPFERQFLFTQRTIEHLLSLIGVNDFYTKSRFLLAGY